MTADTVRSGSRRHTLPVGDLLLESGENLPGVRMAYETWGRLNEARDNAVLVLHALTGDSHVEGPAGPDSPTPGWWPGLIGPGRVLDTDRYFVVAPNVLGGCRGTTGPSSPGPDGRPWGSLFPQVTVRDQVRAEALLADRLGIHTFAAVVGGSMGGMRALEWAVTLPGRVRRCLPIATSAVASADQIGWATPQLFAIRQDPAYHRGDYYPGPGPRTGLELARQIAHATYRTAGELGDRFGAEPQPGEDPLAGGRFAVQSYLEHHGQKLARRFDANSYVTLTESMNTHDIGRDRGGVEAALRRITADLTVVVVDSDRLFTPAEGERIAGSPACRGLVTVSSPFGHDGFLIETDQIFAAIDDALHGRPAQRHRANSHQPSGHRINGHPATVGAAAVGTSSPLATRPYRAEVRPAVPLSAPGMPPVLNGTGLW
ncbi:homoserine O-acetyltransferase [Ornithinimicrobium sp. F0845]|uniref:homoserine O-acetyltransferase MetX n=1 Tax=Ornithinimicrobium sp. F0845 TaxID=2926412 RepID=UPI001FF44363|nr:homoserine O-acetyltransferase [Ornithinimicrobium sp. F0845]MCK0110620.1 homoserine O-acetyltransferase [Ornithinimicrobium sp. F0845]